MGTGHGLGDDASAGGGVRRLGQGDEAGVGFANSGRELSQLSRQFGEADPTFRWKAMPMAVDAGTADAELVRDHLKGIAGGAGKLDLGAGRVRGDRWLPAGLGTGGDFCRHAAGLPVNRWWPAAAPSGAALWHAAAPAQARSDTAPLRLGSSGSFRG